jgi:hypothetical protein
VKVEDLKIYRKKKIKLLLKNRFVYSCVIEEFLENSIKIRDKFGNVIIISVDDISVIGDSGDGL